MDFDKEIADVVQMDMLENFKRKIYEVDNGTQQSDTAKMPKLLTVTSPITSSAQNASNFAILKFVFIDDQSFETIKWELIRNSFNDISNSWKIICFNNNSRGFIFLEENLDKVKTFIEIDSVTVTDNVISKFKISVVTGLGERGIIYHKLLVPYDPLKIEEELKDQDVVKAIKLFKVAEDGKGYPTGSVILEFRESVREVIQFMDVELKVNKLAPRPMICDHCGSLGHTRKKCKKIALKFCKNCHCVHELDDLCIIICKNCGEHHSSLDRRCPAIRKEVDIIYLKEKLQINYFEAKELFSKDAVKTNNVIEENSEKIKKLIQENQLKDVEIQNLKADSKNIFEQMRILRINEDTTLLKLVNANIKIQDIDEELEIAKNKIEQLTEDIALKDNQIKNYQDIIIPQMYQENQQIQIEANNKLMAIKQDFTKQVNDNSVEIANVTKENTSLKARVNFQLKTIENAKLDFNNQKSAFVDFINHSESTSMNYKDFHAKHKKKYKGDCLPNPSN